MAWGFTMSWPLWGVTQEKYWIILLNVIYIPSKINQEASLFYFFLSDKMHKLIASWVIPLEDPEMFQIFWPRKRMDNLEVSDNTLLLGLCLKQLYCAVLLYCNREKTPVLWPSHAKCWLIGKDSEAGRDWGQEEKGTTEDEMAGWHHWLDGSESEWTPGVGDGQGGLACCGSWGRKESDTTERLNWTEYSITQQWNGKGFIIKG